MSGRWRWSTPFERLDAFTDQRGVEECWPWRGHLMKNGYGQFQLESVRTTAHRASYLLRVGPVPGDMQVDHTCGNRACVNPSHLEIVTPGENVRRAAPARKVTCVHGHVLDGRRSTGRRYCKECSRLRARAQHAARRAQMQLGGAA